MTTNNTNTSSINAMPIISANSNVAICNTVLLAYQKACDDLANLNGEALKNARLQLFFGARPHSKVVGVRDKVTVEQLFSSTIMRSSRVIGSTTQYSNGDQVYVFKLAPGYKGWTSYVRLSDLIDEGPSFLQNVGFGLKYDPDKDMKFPEIQAPKFGTRQSETRPCLTSNMLTIVLSPDNSTFIEWYCGEPYKEQRNDWSKVWIQLGVDWDHYFIPRKAHRQNKPENHMAPLNSIASALEIAQLKQTTDAKVEKQPEVVPAVS